MEMAEIHLAAWLSFRPSAREMALAPPMPNRLEMAVSIKKEGKATVTAAVWRGSLSRPTK